MTKLYQNDFRSRTTRRLGASAIALVLAAFLVSACSSTAHSTNPPSSSTQSATSGSVTAHGRLGDSQLASLRQAVTAAEAAAQWQAGGQAIKISGLKGKTVAVVLASAAGIGKTIETGIQAAAKVAGVNVTIDATPDGTVPELTQGITNAVNTQVGAIVLGADPTVLVPAIQKAKSAGIPVILVNNGDPGLTAALRSLGVYADATFCYTCTGQMLADYEILQHDGKLDASIQDFPGYPSSDPVLAGWKEELQKYCPTSCQATYNAMSTSGNFIQQSQTVSQVAATDPSVNVIFPFFDFVVPITLPLVKAANAQSRIDVVSTNADLSAMQALAAGGPVKADPGAPGAWDGWAAMDEVFRALLNRPAAGNEHVPVRLFDVNNIHQLDLTADPGTWYGSASYQTDYEKLWGLQ